MNYTLHQLQIFIKVCELESITRASEELFLTQPAVSIQLKKLQDQFDIPLTEVIGRRLYVTDFGKEIAKVSTNILKEAEKIENTALRYKGLLAGKISISIVSTGKYIMPYFMSSFVKEHQHVDISIDVTNKTKVIDSLIKNETDFALVSVVPENMEVNSIELMENSLFLVGGIQEKTYSKNLSKKQLQTLPMIFREKGSATRNAMETFLKSQDITAKNRLELVSNEAVKQSVCANLGYSIIPFIGMREELESGKLRIIPAKGLPIKTYWRLIYNKNKTLSPAAQAFVEYIEKHKDEVIKMYFPNHQE